MIAKRAYVAILLILALTAAACGGSSKASIVVSPRAATTRPLVLAWAGPSSGAWSLNPWAADFSNNGGSLVLLPLAIQVTPFLTKYIPELARTWAVKGNTLVVTLRSGVKWQNGHPFTSTDVLDTLLLDGAAGGSGVWDDITNIETPTPHRIVLTMRSNVPAALLENNLFTLVTPYPASVYGRFVTSGMKQDDLSYYGESVTDPTAAAQSSAYKALQADFQKLAKFSPKSIVGDGPYRQVAVTTQESKLVRWAGFYDASHIKIPEIIIPEYSQPAVNESLIDNTSDFSNGWVYMPPVIRQRFKRLPDAHFLAISGDFVTDIMFNDKTYPYNLLAVRQALAYLFNFKPADYAADGREHADRQIPDSLVPPVANQYLTKKQLNSLNSYSHDPAKATRLFESAGFHKVHGKWMLPNGKPFTINLAINDAWTSQVLAWRVLASQLNAFGIKATVVTPSNAAFEAAWPTGSFTFSAYCCPGSEPDPLAELADSPLGAVDFVGPGKPGIGYGPVENVPGIGKVNIPKTLAAESATVAPGKKMAQLTWDWARYIDKNLPFLQYEVFDWLVAYSTKYYRFPSTRDPLWSKVRSGPADVLLLLERGQISPQKR